MTEEVVLLLMTNVKTILFIIEDSNEWILLVMTVMYYNVWNIEMNDNDPVLSQWQTNEEDYYYW